MATTSNLRCVVVTPEETVLETEADFVALPLFDGELGVAKHHAPMIGRLGYGELRIRTSEGEKRFYVDGGFVQVADNVVSVLTNQAKLPTKLKADELAQEILTEVHSVSAGDEQIALSEKSVAQLRAQLRVAKRK
ncbi:ATP synthase F1 subunit epsilon [Adhaeretor mobilis]|uniref:ATP synthase epsilon chain n=1 Tax=Adhaeretor mobilis TaxID=1930276 RepID=A0A517MXS7_9BACT|nr:ATP synthase F1 subunit epsilon [Adhaeretor mobilis]QDS99684.1 ATP synthase epsilon chain, sodium ion specific [Adhaeretor mobilis]